MPNVECAWGCGAQTRSLILGKLLKYITNLTAVINYGSTTPCTFHIWHARLLPCSGWEGESIEGVLLSPVYTPTQNTWVWAIVLNDGFIHPMSHERIAVCGFEKWLESITTPKPYDCPITSHPSYCEHCESPITKQPMTGRIDEVVMYKSGTWRVSSWPGWKTVVVSVDVDGRRPINLTLHPWKLK